MTFREPAPPATRIQIGLRRAWEAGRRPLGLALALVGFAAAVLFGLGVWNPWQLVILRYQFGNPMLGLLLVPAVALVAHWLVFPARNSTTHAARTATRLGLAAAVLVGLCGFGIFGAHFRFDTEELARSADGSRAVVIVTDRDYPPNEYLRIWTGTGLAAREAGELGRVCWVRSAGAARFESPDRLVLDTPYGTWAFDLDPVTGVPAQVLGPRCPDGPVPATLGTDRP